MGLFSRFAPKPVAPVVGVATQNHTTNLPLEVEAEKGDVNAQTTLRQTSLRPDVESDGDDELVHKENTQWGVQKSEAVCQVWPRSALFAVYAMIWILYFLDALENTATSLMQPYVLSDFAAHSLVGVTPIMAGIIGGIWRVPLAKVMDIWGRSEAYALMVGAMTLGMIMMASCQNPETYAAAEVFNYLGGNGRSAVMAILIADTSQLKSRGLMFAFIASPYIITSWIAGYFANTFLDIDWRWAFGTWAIVTPVSSLPLFLILRYYERKARKTGIMPERPRSGRTVVQSIKYYLIETDALGLLTLCIGLALFLLPFSIYTRQPDGWRTPFIIALIIVGALLIIAFGLYEAFLAPVTFFPWALLKDRTILGANILAAVLFVEFYLWNNYFSSFVQVVVGQDIVRTGYIQNIYSIGSCTWSFVAGFILLKTGGFKWQAILFGWPVTAMGVGLMIYFRQPGVGVGYIVMCQIFIAIGGGTLVICEQVAGMAATTHQFVAMTLAIQGTSSQIGGAIGSTIAAAIWQANFPDKLLQYLPVEVSSNATAFGEIYQMLDVQLSYVGTPTGDAIVRAYGDTQRLMCAAATGILAIALAAILMWRNIDTRQRKQVKGMVF